MDIAISIISLIGFILLTASTGLFVAIEFALTGMERSTIENHVKEKDDRSAHAVLNSFKNLSFVLSGAQLGITITTLATGFLAEPALAALISPLLEKLGLPESLSMAVALIIAMVVATILSMLFGELVPKNIAITQPVDTARLVVHPVSVFNTVFKWFILSLNKSADFVVRKIGIEPASELATARSGEELGSLVRNSAEHGDIDVDMAEMIENSLEFGDTTADMLMTPRSTIESLDAEDTAADLISLALSSGHSKFPVVNGDLDDTVGVVHIKDAFSVPREVRASTPVSSFTRKVPSVPDTLDGDAVLEVARSSGSQMVLVVDEYGGTAGIITIEDIVEEILGEVYDEYDDVESERDFQQFGTSWEVSGLVRLDDLEEKTGYKAPEGAYETLGGLVMNALGRIPRVGDVVVLPDQGATGAWLARVSVMDHRRVDKVILTPVTDEEAARYQR